MHKNWVVKGYDQCVNLPCTVDEDNFHSYLLIVLLVTLRSIYCKQAIVTTHKQSCKRTEENISENFENKQLTLVTENNF